MTDNSKIFKDNHEPKLESMEDNPYKSTTTEVFETKTYKRRWIILICFILVQITNAAQWIQYSIITNIVVKYYGVSVLMVEYTSLVYLITYLPLVYPASYFIDKKGLRYTIGLAALGNCIGSWFKVFSVAPDRFMVGFCGQTILSCTQLLIISTSPRLAATWFDENQVSTACALGVFGAQLGISLGFICTPLAVGNHNDISEIGNDLYSMFLIIALFSTVVLAAVFFFFEKQPKLPPTKSQALVRNRKVQSKNPNIMKSFKNLLKNYPFIMLMIAYGLNIGTLNAIGTLLNLMILHQFPDSEIFAGRIGLLIIIVGIPGSVIFGYILDKTRRYKETTVVIYIMSAVGMLAFTFALEQKSKSLVYLSSTILGLFMSGYIPVGFEVAAELTYPEPESNSAGLLNSMCQAGGVVLALLFGWIMDVFGDFWSNMSMCITLFIGSIFTICTKNVRRRQDALVSKKESYSFSPIGETIN